MLKTHRDVTHGFLNGHFEIWNVALMKPEVAESGRAVGGLDRELEDAARPPTPAHIGRHSLSITR